MRFTMKINKSKFRTCVLLLRSETTNVPPVSIQDGVEVEIKVKDDILTDD
jgi:hypothetical protein